jgi:hypothetical protein
MNPTKQRRLEQILRDRRLTAEGIKFVAQYRPGDLSAVDVPIGLHVEDAATYRARHRAQYSAYRRGYLETNPTTGHQQRATRAACDAFERFRVSESLTAGGLSNPRAATTFINLDALQAVSYMLGRAPLWVRTIVTGYDLSSTTEFAELAPAEVWQAGFWVLGMRDTPFSPLAGDRLTRSARLFYLKPYDLTSHSTRRERADIPASAVLWQDVLDLRPLVALTGLPIGLPLKRAVRWLVGSWVATGRTRTLPWADPTRGRDADVSPSVFDELRRNAARLLPPDEIRSPAVSLGGAAC